MVNLKNILFLAIVFCFSLTNCAIAKSLNFAVSSDLEYSSNPDSRESANILNGFIDRVNENSYDFVVFLGDNIEKSNMDNLTGFLKAIKKIKCPYYLVMGNKDVHKISGIEKKEYLKAVSKYNHYQKDKSESYYFSPASGILVVVLDSVSSGMPTEHGVFTQRTLNWLDEVLTKNKNKKVIIFQHVPYMTPYDDYPKEILQKNEFRAVVGRHDNVLAIIAGHYKKELIQKGDDGITHICVPALSEEPYYYMNITLEYDQFLFFRGKNYRLKEDKLPAI